MATLVLIIGESGTGKSSSIETLNPKETFVINITPKPLPFRNFRKVYTPQSKEVEGNYFSTDDFSKIESVIEYIDNKRPDIKNIIIDDFQYLMANEYMRRADENGFKKFSDIAQNTTRVLSALQKCRENITGFILSHNEIDENGKSKCKTIGNMLDKYFDVHGLCTIIFHTINGDGQYKFLTQTDGARIAKSPRGMFEERLIDNDLGAIRKAIDDYYLL